MSLVVLRYEAVMEPGCSAFEAAELLSRTDHAEGGRIFVTGRALCQDISGSSHFSHVGHLSLTVTKPEIAFVLMKYLA